MLEKILRYNPAVIGYLLTEQSVVPRVILYVKNTHVPLKRYQELLTATIAVINGALLGFILYATAVPEWFFIPFSFAGGITTYRDLRT